MKRFFVFLLMLFYVASVSGAALNLHYCGKKLRHISVVGLGHNGCCCKKPMAKKNCCKDEVVSLKKGKEHQQAEASFVPVSVSKTFASEVPVFLNNTFLFDFPSSFQIIYPPPILAGGRTLFVLNNVFRI